MSDRERRQCEPICRVLHIAPATFHRHAAIARNPELASIDVVVGDDLLPTRLRADPADVAEIGDYLQLVIARQVVADVVVEDLPLFRGGGILDREGDDDGRAAAFLEDVAAFFASRIAAWARIPSQVIKAAWEPLRRRSGSTAFT